MAAQSGVYRHWLREVERKRFFRAGERVGVAVSGGPDSVLLLDFMAGLAKRLGLALAVVHFNHKLRGAASDADEQFVRRLAQAYGHRVLRGEADVAGIARDARRNLEATARELRYRFFFSLIRQGELEKVATAHTANDQAETVILRLLRGAGTRGLGGIYPVLEGKIVRPFLTVTRAAVEAEVAKRSLKFRTDSTNADPRFRRNKIRLELLPMLEREYNPEAPKLLAELAERSRDDEALLEELARERAKPWWVQDGGEEKIPLRALEEFPAALARRVLRQMIQAARGKPGGVTHGQIEELRRFAARARSGRGFVLPGRLTVRKDFEWLVLEPAARCRDSEGFAYPVKVPGQVLVPEIARIFQFEIVCHGAAREAYNKRVLLGMDLLKSSKGLVLRSWRPGDRFQPAGARKPEKLKGFFRERKIPLRERRLWPVLAGESGILWVRGFGPASSAAPRESGGDVLVTETPAPGERR